MSLHVQKIQEILTRGIDQIITERELERVLVSKKKIKIYLGVDPSGPIIHLGHAVVLRKLREFQKLGHKVILLIGDFTGRIGDPTDKESERQPLTHKQVLENAKHYQKQASKILKFFGENSAEIKFNSHWLDKLTFREVIELAANFTVQQMLERDMFTKRYKEGKPIGLHEFLYPLMQGYDSVAMDVDMEVGGSDQLFNMLAGRTLRQNIKKKNKIVMTFELLEGTDGRKMSKSYYNMIGVEDEPKDMYGKIMSLRDELITRYFTLCTDIEMTEIKKMEKDLKFDKVNPRDLKMQLAREIVTIYHSKKEAKEAEHEFIKIFQKHKSPDKIKISKLTIRPRLDAEPSTTRQAYGREETQNLKIVDVLLEIGLVESKGEARRLIKQKGIKVDGEVVSNEKKVIKVTKKGVLIQRGKRHFVKVRA